MRTEFWFIVSWFVQLSECSSNGQWEKFKNYRITVKIFLSVDLDIVMFGLFKCLFKVLSDMCEVRSKFGAYGFRKSLSIVILMKKFWALSSSLLFAIWFSHIKCHENKLSDFYLNTAGKQNWIFGDKWFRLFVLVMGSKNETKLSTREKTGEPTQTYPAIRRIFISPRVRESRRRRERRRQRQRRQRELQ